MRQAELNERILFVRHEMITLASELEWYGQLANPWMQQACALRHGALLLEQLIEEASIMETQIDSIDCADVS